MQENNLTIGIRHLTDEISVLDLQGTINAQAEEQLMDAYKSVTDRGTKQIILNFTDLTYMNSSGIGLLVTMLVRTNRNEQRLCAINVSEHYRQIFDLTRLNEAIGLFDSEEAALVG